MMADAEVVTILCCQCGAPTIPNESRLCVQCLESTANILQGISDTNTVFVCRSCERYENRPVWLRCDWESKELLALCIRRIKKPKEARLVKAEFIWTEPHSKRIRIRIGIEKEVYGTTLFQEMVITFIVGNRQCEECCKSVTPHLWISAVQVRQRAAHKRTLLYMEQLILRNEAHAKCLNIVDNSDGLDFQFAKPQHAATLVQFIKHHLCAKIHPIATQLISHDSKSNTYHHKYTQLIDLCDVCRDDLVYLPKRIATLFGGCSQLMLCRRVTTGIHLIDPFTLRGVDMDGEKYWKTHFPSILSRGNLTEFLVLNSELLQLTDIKSAGVAGRFLTGMMECEDQKSSVKRAWGGVSTYHLAEIEIARVSDIGRNDRRFTVRSHLGAILRPGDIVLGYDLVQQNIMDVDNELNEVLANCPFEAILVKKATAKQSRAWALKVLPKSTVGGDYAKIQPARMEGLEAFKEDLEEDPIMRANVDVYRDPRITNIPVQDSSLIDITNMIQGLTIEDAAYVI